MEAKDTVMNDATKRQFIYIKNKPDGNLRGFMESDALLCQAEISFKAGMRKVVEWVETRHLLSNDETDAVKAWQAFLKENGAERPEGAK